jgi:DNA polymerase III sliding clamp (beta) subunit (PCNA family)
MRSANEDVHPQLREVTPIEGQDDPLDPQPQLEASSPHVFTDVRAASFSQPKEKQPMSKIALPIAELKPALTGLGKVIKKHSLPVLHHVKIERTAEGWLALTATDLDTFITCRLEQPSTGEPISLLVPYDELLKITKNCEKKDTILVGAEEKASVTIEYAVGTQVAKAKVNSLPVEEFPSIPQMKGGPTPLNDALRLAIHEAMECASADPTRLILNGAFLDLSKPKAHYVVGTDGRHLFSSNSFNLPLKESLIIPSHKFVEWKEFNNDGEWQLKTASAEKKDEHSYLQISSRRWRFITRQIEGSYPNWRQNVPSPSSSNITLTFDPQTLKQVITTIEKMPCHDAVNLTIGLEWKNGKLHLLGKAARDAEWMKVPVEVKGMGPDISIYLNRHLLTKAFGFGLNTLGLIDRMSPLRFSQEGRQMIVMPLRADVGNPPPQPAKKAEPAKAEAPQPAATPPAAQPEERNTTMPKNNGNGSHQEPAADKPTLEKALADIEKIKGSYRDAIRGLNDLGDMLKAISKERKSTEKEVQSVRSTLEKLQSVRL